MKIQNKKIIKKTFQKINDLVVPTMGAKGRLAVIHKDFDRPMLTDDGVTVARETVNLKDFEQTIAISIIEAASNTEREAFDGTTLTILLTNELYKQGLKWVRRGLDEQSAADRLVKEVEHVRELLKKEKFEATPELLKSLAVISTKIPAIGEIVYKAHQLAGDDMNIVIEHDRDGQQTSVEHVDGMVIESGYFSEVMKQFATEEDKTIFYDAHIALLSSGLMTQTNIKEFLMSIPSEAVGFPFVFFITPQFNPESLQFLLQVLIENKFNFQFVFLNEESVDELYLDIAAKTGSFIQDAAYNSIQYKYEHCGIAGKIEISKDKTIITKAHGNVTQRIKTYQKELKKDMYTIGVTRYHTIKRRLAALEKGITKIKLAASTVTEFVTIRMKLDDAIGAVKTAIKEGLVIGGGKTLYNISRHSVLKKALRAPLKQIINNAGMPFLRGVNADQKNIINVVTQKVEPWDKEGIVDSYLSVDSALRNASSIASQYLRTYILIRK